MILINLKLVLQPVYGVTSSWLLAAVTLIFIQMQSYAEKYIWTIKCMKKNADIMEQQHLYLNEVYDFGTIKNMVTI